MAGRDFSGWWTRNGYSPETLDRIVVGLCALIWLVLLGFSVAAVVALVDLGRGFHTPAHNPHTGLLYIIIGVSALIILASIPMLLRARRRTTPTPPAARPTDFPPQSGGGPPVQPAQRAGFYDRTSARHSAASLIGPGGDEVDRALLRGTSELVSAIGTALIAVAVATYLMAIGKDAAAWVCYGVAGFVTAVMPTVPWRYPRRLRATLASYR